MECSAEKTLTNDILGKGMFIPIVVKEVVERRNRQDSIISFGVVMRHDIPNETPARQKRSLADLHRVLSVCSPNELRYLRRLNAGAQIVR